MSLFTEITIFVLAAFVGFEVISKVPTTLHTPLMSQTNAIHGIVMLGGLIVVGYANDPLEYVIGTIAIAFGAINIVGGFMVTDRMLGMFSKKPKPKADADGKGGSLMAQAVLAARWRRRHRALHRRLLALHHRDQTRHPPDHGQAGQPGRRRRHGDRRRHHPACSTGSATGA